MMLLFSMLSSLKRINFKGMFMVNFTIRNVKLATHKYSHTIDLYTPTIEINSGIANGIFRESNSSSRTQVFKGYYRCDVAYLAMENFKESLKDFQQIILLLFPTLGQAGYDLSSRLSAISKNTNRIFRRYIVRNPPKYDIFFYY
ncbi:hypothetical protein L6452_25767 [Arctium lappa]|uniref:Uncharacterized protein n=1 Tax=Arctium lappa TaxID=4217 RepID=A0ACB9ABV7_ARCLA|nr:hypothetical protein L6452_25767 [Arctium lappa]